MARGDGVFAPGSVGQVGGIVLAPEHHSPHPLDVRFNNEADQSAYDAQWEHLLTQQVEIWGRSYKFSEIEEKLKLSPAEYRALSWLIVPDEQESGEAGSEADAKLKAKAKRV